MMEQARQKMQQETREKDALRKRCSRKLSSRLPTLPKTDVGVIRRKFAVIQAQFRKLGHSRRLYSKQGRDVTDISHQLGDLLTQARAIVDEALASQCDLHILHKTFPRLARTHPMYECLDGLRKAHRRLWDRLRKHAREDLAAQDAEIVDKLGSCCRAVQPPSSPEVYSHRCLLKWICLLEWMRWCSFGVGHSPFEFQKGAIGSQDAGSVQEGPVTGCAGGSEAWQLRSLRPSSAGGHRSWHGPPHRLVA